MDAFNQFNSKIDNIKSLWENIKINIENINYLWLIKIALIAIVVGVILRLVVMLIQGFKTTKKEMNTIIHKKIDDSVAKRGNFSAYEEFLSKNGIMYRFHNYKMAPSTYFIAKGVFSVLFGLFVYLATLSTIAGGISAVILFFCIDKIMKVLSKSDDKEMQMDMYMTYMALKNQLSAGIYITNVLVYVHDNIYSKRYKEALKELVRNLSDKNCTTDNALLIFKNRFNSQQINNLYSMLCSYFSFGADNNLLDSLTSEIVATLEADTLAEQERADNITSAITVALFGVIILMILGIAMTGTSAMNILTF